MTITNYISLSVHENTIFAFVLPNTRESLKKMNYNISTNISSLSLFTQNC